LFLLHASHKAKVGAHSAAAARGVSKGGMAAR
jgi:hypothetical protein